MPARRFISIVTSCFLLYYVVILTTFILLYNSSAACVKYFKYFYLNVRDTPKLIYNLKKKTIRRRFLSLFFVGNLLAKTWLHICARCGISHMVPINVMPNSTRQCSVSIVWSTCWSKGFLYTYIYGKYLRYQYILHEYTRSIWAERTRREQ